SLSTASSSTIDNESLRDFELKLRDFRRCELANRKLPSILNEVLDLVPRLFIYALSWAAMFLATGPLALFAAVVCSIATVSLFGSWYHDALHNNLRWSRWVQFGIRISIASPFAISRTWWTLKHIRGHHGYPRDSKKDPDVQFGKLARIVET